MSVYSSKAYTFKMLVKHPPLIIIVLVKVAKTLEILSCVTEEIDSEFLICSRLGKERFLICPFNEHLRSLMLKIEFLDFVGQ